MSETLNDFRGWANLLLTFASEDFSPSLIDEAKEWSAKVKETVDQDSAMLKALMCGKYADYDPEDMRWVSRRIFSPARRASYHVARWWVCRDVLLEFSDMLVRDLESVANALGDLQRLDKISAKVEDIRMKRVDRDRATARVRGLAANIVETIEEYPLYLNRAHKALDPAYQYEEPKVWKADIYAFIWDQAAQELMLWGNFGRLCPVPLIRATAERRIWGFLSPKKGSRYEGQAVWFKRETKWYDIVEALGKALYVPPDVISGLYGWTSETIHYSYTRDVDEMWYALAVAERIGAMDLKTETQLIEATDKAIDDLLAKGKIELRPVRTGP